MDIGLSDMTKRRIKEVIALDLTLHIGVLLSAENILRMDLFRSGKNSTEINVLLENLQSIRLGLELADRRLRALREHI